MITLKLISSLEKVFPCVEPACAEYSAASCLMGEIFSFQIAAFSDKEATETLEVTTEAEISVIRLSAVKYVPGMLPAYLNKKDDNYISLEPGIFPDVLEPLTGKFNIVGGQWRSLWVEIGAEKAGIHPIKISIGEKSVLFMLEVIAARLPKQELIYTQWFHCDCLASYYKTEVFSPEHWILIDRYMENAAKYGMNMIMTPVFTPPLDTEIGSERMTVQLVDITLNAGKYTFGYEKLDKYIEMAQSHGIEYFEIAHPFTQWGAGFAPKIVAVKNGKLQKIFGWETVATSPEYIAFIRQFISELKLHLKLLGIFERSYFHISDEPSEDMLGTYGAALDVLKDLYEDCNVSDALSEYAFYEKGLVRNPIPATDHITPFIENAVPNLWTYYCCAQNTDVSNRFLAMPSARNRIISYQLFKYDIEGFLHWGYNFWYKQNSRGEIDPYSVTDGGEAFPAGDPFSVYPGADGSPVPSLRQIVFNEALQDLRAMKLLTNYMSKEDILLLLNSNEITFSSYPKEPEFQLKNREIINAKIKSFIH